MRKVIKNKNGTKKADTLLISKNSLTIKAGGGNDTITLSKGRKNKVYGGAGNDTITLSGGKKNAIYGNGGADTIIIGKKAGTGNKIYGNDGNDIILIKGGKGNMVAGDTGIDKITVSGGSGNYIGGNGGSDIITVAKTAGSNNKIWGDAGADRIILNGGSQIADGGAGKDRITVNGGTGHVLTGGKEKDTFLFNRFTGNVTITDYQYGTDTIRLGKDTVTRAELFGSDTVLYLSDGRTITLKNAGKNSLTYINPAGKKVTVKLIVTQQNVIRSFMKALDDSALLLTSAKKALNAAVKYASNNKYKTWNDLLDSFICDIRKYGSTEGITFEQVNKEDGCTVLIPQPETHTFLTKFCGIDLKNEDTGAITGSDAGGSMVKTAEGIVPESGTMAALKEPASKTTTIEGLTFHWPETKTAAQKTIISAINTWWAKEGLSLVKDSFGLNFQEKGATVSDIDVKFVNENNDKLAEVRYVYKENGQVTRLILNINLTNFSKINLADVNGYAGETSGYMDRVIAHELTHAVMAANITGFNNLPDCVTEGAAELVHGIDDFRTLDIIALAQVSNADTLQEALYNMDPYTVYDINYAGGYMLQRYFAKQVADSFHL
jgi:hypothetical protein